VVFAGSQSLTMPELHPLVPQAATVVTIFRTADTSYNILGTTNSTSNRWRDTDGNGNLGLFTRAIEADFPLNMPAVGNYYSSIRISQTYGLEFLLNGFAASTTSLVLVLHTMLLVSLSLVVVFLRPVRLLEISTLFVSSTVY
jgi:hypothetical protein